jgi:hypothetical protein
MAASGLGVDFLAYGQGVVCCLGQQDEGEPEILALRVPDEKQTKNGESDQGGGDAVGIGIYIADIAGCLTMLLFD